MPIELLKKIAAQELPLTISSQHDIDKLRVLSAAGMVIAELPTAGIEGPATVIEITKYGQIALCIGEDPDN